LAIITASLAFGGIVWYRRKVKKMSWGEVFLLKKPDDDGSNIVMDEDKEEESERGEGSNGKRSLL
jgi:hypothetical protein